MESLNIEVDEWEVAVNRVLLQDVIGRGTFGAVWRALLSSPNGQPGNRTVAAKCFTRKPPSVRSINTYGGGGEGREDRLTYNIINQFGSKSDPGIAVILQ